MIDVLTDQEKESRISVRQAVSFIVALAVSAALIFIGIALALPYAPTAVDLYEILPGVVCPGDEIEIRAAFDVAKPPLGDVERFSVDSTLVNATSLDRIGLPETSFPFSDPPYNGRYGHHDNISPVKRFAPNDPGVWYLETNLTTHGKQTLRLAKSTVTGIVSNSFRVRDFDEPECRAIFGG